MVKENQNRQGEGPRWAWAAVLVIAIGLVVRLWKAWTGHLSPNCDFGIVGLMAKHMAEGRDFPIFFYGQPYMGSLEPLVSAVLCRIFGFSTFMVCAGTALVGTLLLPLTYVWARDASGSRRAGVMAMLFCLVGSDALFHYSVAPRGGYMTLMATGVFTVWLAARIASSTIEGRTVRLRSYVGLGLAAGLGWWSSQLVVAFLATAVVVLMSSFRWRMMREGFLPASLAFLVGSAPWWIWNACHGWATFEFGGSLGTVAVGHGLRTIGKTFLALVEMPAAKDGWAAVRLALLAGTIGLFVVITVRDRIRRQDPGRFPFRLAALLLLILAVAVSVTSKYVLLHETRYLLPMFPALAVALGVAGDWLLRAWRVPVGWIVVALLIPTHLYDLPRLPEGLAGDRPVWETASELADELGPRCDGVCIGDFARYHWMNLASTGRLCVAALPKEKYAPYARRAELAERPAFLGDYHDIGAFLATTRATGVHAVMQGIAVDYALTPPSDDWRYVDPAGVVAIEGGAGSPYGNELIDGIIDTTWGAAVEVEKPAEIVFTFHPPVRLCGLRLLLGDRSAFPRRLAVAGQGEGDATWSERLPMTVLTGYFWSGHHVMLQGMQFYQEIRFDAPPEGVTRLRLTFAVGGSPNNLRLAEILFMEPTAGPGESLPTADACVAAIRRQSVKQFYGPRWMADRVALATKGELVTAAPSLILRSVNELPLRDPPTPIPVTLRERTGFLMDARDAPRSREVLRHAGLLWDETRLGRYVLLVVPKPGETAAMARYPTLYWTEQGCFASDRTPSAGETTRGLSR